MNFITRFPNSLGHTVIWVICYWLTKHTHFVALPQNSQFARPYIFKQTFKNICKPQLEDSCIVFLHIFNESFQTYIRERNLKKHLKNNTSNYYSSNQNQVGHNNFSSKIIEEKQQNLE